MEELYKIIDDCKEKLFKMNIEEFREACNMTFDEEGEKLRPLVAEVVKERMRNG